LRLPPLSLLLAPLTTSIYDAGNVRECRDRAVTSRQPATAAIDTGHAPADPYEIVGGDALCGDVGDHLCRTHDSPRTQQAHLQRVDHYGLLHRKRHADARRDGSAPSLCPSFRSIAGEFIDSGLLGC
jgi:hypothetical protein